MTMTDPEIDAVRGLARASSVLERSSDELSLAHYRVLSAIASGQDRASNVAARLALGRPAVSAAVEALTQRGLLERSVVDGDHRAAALRLTADGEEVLGRVELAMRLRIRSLAGLTADPERLLEALAWLGEAVDEWRQQRRRQAPGREEPARAPSQQTP